MPYLANDPNQDPNQTPGQQQAAGGAGVVIGGAAQTGSDPSAGPTLGGASGPITGGAVGGAGAAGAAPTSSGSFTNLNAYVGANQGNDATMGQTVTSDVAGHAADASKAGNDWKGQVGGAIDANTVKTDDGVIGALNKMGVSEDANAPTQDAFTKQYNAKYAGPTADGSGGTQQITSVGDFSGVSSKYHNATQFGDAATGNEGQQGGLLSDTYARGGQQYGSGMAGLDGYLLNNGAQGKQALQGITQNYGSKSQFGNELGSTVQGLGSRATTAAQTTAQTAKTAQDAANAAAGRLGKIFEQDKTYAGDLNTKNQGITKAVGSGDTAALKAAGLSDDAIAELRAKNNFTGLAEYGNRNLGDVVNASDASNYQNLHKLITGAGGTHTDIYGNDLAKAGGHDVVYNKNNINFDNTTAAGHKAEQEAWAKAQIAQGQDAANQAAKIALNAQADRAAADQAAKTQANAANVRNPNIADPNTVYVNNPNPNAPQLVSSGGGPNSAGVSDVESNQGPDHHDDGSYTGRFNGWAANQSQGRQKVAKSDINPYIDPHSSPNKDAWVDAAKTDRPTYHAIHQMLKGKV